MAARHSTIARYVRIWRRAVTLNFSVLAASRLDLALFVPGKLLRMGFFVVLPLVLFEYTPTLAGYDRGQVLLFFAMMNFIDVFSQIFFLRGLNLMPRYIRQGELDFVLVKPISPLFWTMFRIVDFFDVLTMPGALAYVFFAVSQLGAAPLPMDYLLWIGFSMLAIVLAFCVVLTMTSLGFFTTEIENVHFLYRDAMNIGRFPPEVFPRGLQVALSSVLPVLVIVSVPAKALMGQLSWQLGLAAVAVTLVWAVIATFAWRVGMRHYTSASS